MALPDPRPGSFVCRLGVAGWMLIAVVLGIGLGLWANVSGNVQVSWLTSNVIEPIGQMYLRLLQLLVLPLVICALALGIHALGDVRALGRIGLRCLLWSAALSVVAVIIGVTLVQMVGPGHGVDRAALEGLSNGQIPASPLRESVAATIVAMVPANAVKAMADNQMISVLLATVLFGIGLLLTRTPASTRLVELLQGLLDVCLTMLDLVIRIAPLGVGCLLFAVASKLGLTLIGHLALYAGVVVTGLLIHLVVVYGLVVRFAGGRSPWQFFGQIRPAIVTAFATASSAATLPTSLRVAEERVGLPPAIARFVITVGASANQHGTALFEGVAVLFLAQVYGVELTLLQQVMACGICILAGLGTAGIPAGSLPVVMMILTVVGVPPEAVAMVIGIDRVLDMCRTTVNVAGDLVLATAISGPPTANSSPDLLNDT